MYLYGFGMNPQYSTWSSLSHSFYYFYIDLKVRLVGGESNNEGQVEVQYDGQWRSICDNNWGISEANVICNQLGLP